MMLNPLRLAHSLLLACAGLLTTGIAPGGAQADPDVEALLQLHHEHRVAHVLRASRRFTVTFADTLIDVSGGVVSRRARSDSERQFDAYFSVLRFLEWDDVAPPVIHVAKDGTLATVTVAKRVRALVGTAATGIREDAAHFAWTSTWPRGEGTWRVVAIASTERPEAAPERAPLTDMLEAYEILHAAREAVSGQAAVASVSMVSFAAACEGPRTGLPLGFRLPQPPGPRSLPVATWFDDWRGVGPVLLPFSVDISQGEEVFRYRVTEASTDSLSDDDFVAASRRSERTFLFDELAPGVLAAVVVPDPPHYAFANSLVVDLGEELLVVDTQQSPSAPVRGARICPQARRAGRAALPLGRRSGGPCRRDCSVVGRRRPARAAGMSGYSGTPLVRKLGLKFVIPVADRRVGRVRS